NPINGQTNITGYLYKGRILKPWVDNGLAGAIQHSGQDTERVAGRLNGKFGNSGFDWQVGFAQSWNDTTFGSNDTVINRLGLAVNGYGGPGCTYTPANDPTAAHRGQGLCEFWDPFAISGIVKPGDPAYNDPALTSWLYGLRTTDDVGQLRTYDAISTGKLWDMPGGTTGLAVGLERRELDFSQTWDTGSKQINYWGIQQRLCAVGFLGLQRHQCGVHRNGDVPRQVAGGGPGRPLRKDQLRCRGQFRQVQSEARIAVDTGQR